MHASQLNVFCTPTGSVRAVVTFAVPAKVKSHFLCDSGSLHIRINIWQ